MFRLLCAASIAAFSMANAHAGIVAEQIVEKEVVTKNADGTIAVKQTIPDTVTPGEELIYSLNFTNESADAAEAVVLVMPVPAVVSYIEGSVSGDDAAITFSADGGQTYVARGRLTVAEGGAARPARSDEITHIKWTLADALSPAGKGKISYRAILK